MGARDAAHLGVDPRDAGAPQGGDRRDVREVGQGRGQHRAACATQTLDHGLELRAHPVGVGTQGDDVVEADDHRRKVGAEGQRGGQLLRAHLGRAHARPGEVGVAHAGIHAAQAHRQHVGEAAQAAVRVDVALALGEAVPQRDEPQRPHALDGTGERRSRPAKHQLFAEPSTARHPRDAVCGVPRPTVPGMRVAIVTESYLPTVNGVTGTVVRAATHLTAQGHEVLVVAPEGAGAEAAHPWTVVRAPAVTFPGYAACPGGGAHRAPVEHRDGVRARRGARRRPDRARRVGCRDGPPPSACRSSRCTRPTSPASPRTTGSPLRGVRVALAATGARAAAAPWRPVVGPCGAQSPRRPDVHRWPRGVDTELFHPVAPRRSLRDELAPGGEVLVGYVGRLAGEKRVEHLLALRGLPGVRVVVVGDGPERARVHRAVPGRRSWASRRRRPGPAVRVARRLRPHRHPRDVLPDRAGGAVQRCAGGRARVRRPPGPGAATGATACSTTQTLRGPSRKLSGRSRPTSGCAATWRRRAPLGRRPDVARGRRRPAGALRSGHRHAGPHP